MIQPTIKSRPVYGRLAPRAGTFHLLVADGEGAKAITDMKTITDMAAAAWAEFFSRAHIVYIAASSSERLLAAALRGLAPAVLHESPSIEAALPRLHHMLATARMGTRLYVAGSEGLIGRAIGMAIAAGMDHAEIETEHRGSQARRVQCVHCKGITERVTTQPATCAHCGLVLLVRDHFSRRIGAFQGVCIDAEEPGVIPPAEEIFR